MFAYYYFSRDKNLTLQVSFFFFSFFLVVDFLQFNPPSKNLWRVIWRVFRYEKILLNNLIDTLAYNLK